MADNQEVIEADPQAVFDSLDAGNRLSGEPESEAVEPEVSQPEAEPAPAEPEADTGEPEVEPIAAEAELDETPDAQGRVPSGIVREKTRKLKEAETALDEERKARAAEADRIKAMEQQIAEMRGFLAAQQKQAQQPVDEADQPYIDPEVEAQLSQARHEMQTAIVEIRLQNSLDRAADKYGDEYGQAYDAVMKSGDPMLAQRIMANPNPGEALVNHYRSQRVFEETGGDLNSYFEKTFSERLSDPAFAAQVLEKVRGNAPATDQTGRPNVNLAPDVVNNGTRAAPSVDPGGDLPTGQALFDQLDRKASGR